MVSKTRLPNKAIWAIEDIIAVTSEQHESQQRALDALRRLEEYAKRKQDAALMARLVPLLSELTQQVILTSQIRTIAADARKGEYNQ